MKIQKERLDRQARILFIFPFRINTLFSFLTKTRFACCFIYFSFLGLRLYFLYLLGLYLLYLFLFLIRIRFTFTTRIRFTITIRIRITFSTTISLL
jgi:hypothetical protein